MADEVVSLAERRLHNALSAVFDQVDVMAVEVRAVLEKHGFPVSYIEPCLEDLKDGWLNSDEIPLWRRAGYTPGE